MNCNKPEELAVVNWPGTVFHNCIITTKELITAGEWFTFLDHPLVNGEGAAWWVECGVTLHTTRGDFNRFPVYDKFLRPIGSPEQGGTEQRTFQRPLPTIAESIAGAMNKQKFGGQS